MVRKPAQVVPLHAVLAEVFALSACSQVASFSQQIPQRSLEVYSWNLARIARESANLRLVSDCSAPAVFGLGSSDSDRLDSDP